MCVCVCTVQCVCGFVCAKTRQMVKRYSEMVSVPRNICLGAVLRDEHKSIQSQYDQMIVDRRAPPLTPNRALLNGPECCARLRSSYPSLKTPRWHKETFMILVPAKPVPRTVAGSRAGRHFLLAHRKAGWNQVIALLWLSFPKAYILSSSNGNCHFLLTESS